MAMGDELGSAVVNVSTTAVQSGINTVTKLIAEILRMMRASSEHRQRMNELKLKSGIDISDLKPGKVKIKDLISSARKNGDSVSTSSTGLSDKDVALLEKSAKKFGVPISFTQSGECNYVHVRSRDLPIFKRMMTEMMQQKLASNSQELSNFKVNAWEIPFITSELNKFKLNASFAQTRKGDYFCMFEKADEKAILIARGEFVKKYSEVKKDFITDCDEEGFFTLKDIKTGREISFDDSKKSFNELSDEIQQVFGYDKNKADIAAAKFGEENLDGEEKENYFDNPQNDTQSIISNIALETDDIYASQYACMRVVPKSDSVQRIVFSDNDGRFAVLNPNMTRSEIEEELKTQLNITDSREMKSIADKAESVMLYYAKHEDVTRYSSEYQFSKNDFDMTDIDTVSGLKREIDGHIYTRDLPLDRLNIDIDRTGKDSFTVKSNAVHVETNENGEYSKSVDSRFVVLSFSDKKKAVHELQKLLSDQGVPESVAQRAAFDVFGKAESQESEKVMYIEEVKSENTVYYSDDIKVEAEVYCAGKTATIDVSDSNTGKQQIVNEFGVTEEQAAGMFGDTSNKLTDRQRSLLGKYGYDCSDWSVGEASFVIEKISENSWKVPEGMEPENFSIDRYREASVLNTEKSPAIEIPSVDIDTEEIDDVVSMGM